MRFIYTFGIQCYAAGVKVAALWNPKAKQMVEGWSNTFGRLSIAPVGKNKTAWFHASSLGEFEQARPVLERFKIEHPDYKVCVTFFSPSGYEVRKDYPEADFVCYLPMDTMKNARRFVSLLHPSVVFFAKYDFWFNYLTQLKQREVPTYIFSSIFRKNQYFFKWYGKWYLNHLKECFTHIFVQNEESVQLLKNHGITHVSIAGDTRFDRVHAIAQDAKRNEVVERFLQHHEGKKVLLAGSSWEPDETYLHDYWKSHPDSALVLAPHVIDEDHLKGIEALFGIDNCVRYSKIDTMNNGASVLIVDNIGLLSSMYRYADVAYIGGGFGKGIHNILEAVTFGKPVVFGPNYHKFKEACDIIALGGGQSYQRYDELETALDAWLTDEASYQKASNVCLQYLADNLGSAELILGQLDKQIFLC